MNDIGGWFVALLRLVLSRTFLIVSESFLIGEDLLLLLLLLLLLAFVVEVVLQFLLLVVELGCRETSKQTFAFPCENLRLYDEGFNGVLSVGMPNDLDASRRTCADILAQVE